eukprot:SAG22_NODE_17807_length_298_cov_0.768844_1_plen_52_part_10
MIGRCRIACLHHQNEVRVSKYDSTGASDLHVRVQSDVLVRIHGNFILDLNLC